MPCRQILEVFHVGNSTRWVVPVVLGLLCTQSSRAVTVPAGANIEIRLQQEVNSYSSVAGSAVRAVLIAPVLAAGKVAIPAGSLVYGQVESVRRVGLGLIRERATMVLNFTVVELPDRRRIAINSRVILIDNARELANHRGVIRGLRSTSTPGYRASAVLTSLAAVDPIALGFATAAFASILRFSEPEIRFPAGTDLRLMLLSPLEAGDVVYAGLPPLAQNKEEAAVLHKIIQGLPYRTRTQAGNQDSDLTNLAFAGDRHVLRRAFLAAGWVEPDALTAAVKYRALRSFAENQPFLAAPMSELTLDGRSPVLSLSKSLNTFAKRHHLRIFSTGESWDDDEVFTASSTHDIAVGFGKSKIVHRIDEYIDAERAKVVNDLISTGCVDAVESVPRPWIPKISANATGDRLVTDGRITVVRMNACRAPRRSDEAVAPPPGPYRGNVALRISRQALLTLRNDLLRGNFAYMGITTLVTARRLIKSRGTSRIETAVQEESVGAAPNPGQSFVETRRASQGPAREVTLSVDKWEPARVEIGFRVGTLQFGGNTTGPEGLVLFFQKPMALTATNFALTSDNEVKTGWLLGTAVTLNTQRWFSHELGFQYQRGSFRLGLMGIDNSGHKVSILGIEEQRAGLLTRRFTYSTMFHFRPVEKRLRPYVAAGPAIELIHLTDAPFQKARGVFRFGLNNVGMIRAAYNFGSAAPLEGGGIFHTSAQLGGGMKYRVRPRWTLVVDYRNTFGKPIDFLSKSLRTEVPGITLAELASAQPISRFGRHITQHRISTGFSFTF